MKLAFTLLVNFFFSLACQAAELDALGWLQGHWKLAGTYELQFTSAEYNIIMGSAKKWIKEGGYVFTEAMEINSHEGRFYWRSGYGGSWKWATDMTENSVNFFNNNIEIYYERKDADTLIVKERFNRPDFSTYELKLVK